VVIGSQLTGPTSYFRNLVIPTVALLEKSQATLSNGRNYSIP